MQGLKASASSENLADERIRRAVNALHPGAQDEALKQVTRYAALPESLETILSILEKLKNFPPLIQPTVVLCIKCHGNSNMAELVDSLRQISAIEAVLVDSLRQINAIEAVLPNQEVAHTINAAPVQDQDQDQGQDEGTKYIYEFEKANPRRG